MGTDQGISGLAFEVLDPAPVGVGVTRGPDHVLIYANPVYRTTFGDRPVGSPLRDVFSDLLEQDYFALFDQVYATGSPIVLRDAPVSLSFPDEQEQRFFTFSLSRIDLGGHPYGVLTVVVEVTAQVTAAQRVQAIADERQRILRRFRSLVRVGAQIVWVTGPTGQVVEPSPGWEQVTGRSWEEFRRGGWDAVHPDDRAPARESWQRALAEVPELWEYVYRLSTHDAGFRHFLVRAVPIHANGAVIEWVGTCTDIEQQWEEQFRRRLLDRAAAATADLSNLSEMLAALAEVLVSEVADGCGVYLLTDFADGDPETSPFLVQRVATAARAGMPRLPPFSAEHLTPTSGFVRAVRRRRPVREAFPPGSPPPDLLTPGAQSWLVESGANSVVIFPVEVDGTVAAVVTAAVCGSRPPLTDDHIVLLGEIFDHAHDALSSAIRFQRTQRVALALQHSLLVEPPRLPDLEITARYRPSPAAADVGGDWYDSFLLPDGATALAIGDVAGHDLLAAVAMSQLRNMLRALAVDRLGPPGEVLGRLNLAIDALYEEATATCVLARVETVSGIHRLSYSVAGHLPPLLISAEGEGRFLEEANNPLLGLLADGPYLSAVEPLPPRCTLLLYTDGLVEHPDEDLDQGLARLRRHAESLARRPVDAFCDELLVSLPMTGKDDVAIIAVRLPES
ncbi:SpoIIE family protein phosphatase [Nonomuraea sp. NN258]|uniref:SpoIIE family protein phosphatase n=1 Tax=Nonomuraea antri TaxID=2730852 RepID=UPI0015683EB4|nr:SpoIIE family protein phosphatase [Nonomuraea antri]NRQ30413.1 SpoIIE family protein phosphatase [Nonomuraea antri]